MSCSRLWLTLCSLDQAFITKPEVEVRNINRVILKAQAFSQDIASDDVSQV